MLKSLICLPKLTHAVHTRQKKMDEDHAAATQTNMLQGSLNTSTGSLNC